MSRKTEGETKKKKSSGAPARKAPARTVANKKAEEPAPKETVAAANLDDLGELPHSYGSDTIFLVAQEPHWLFTYWDIDISRHPGGQTFLRVYEGNETVEAEIEVPFETRNWYIPVKTAGSKYTVEIGYYRGQAWNVIARSVTIQTPTDRLSDSHQFEYATIPLHMSFQKMVENVQTSIQSGESLIQALSRMQKDGKLSAFGNFFMPEIPATQHQVLEALLGSEMLDELSSGSFSSEEIETRIRQHLKEKLGSEGASELLAKGEWGALESSLFSAFREFGGSSQSGGAASNSSWGGAGSASWENAASSSWGGSALSSWGISALSSWATAALASWNSAPQTTQSSWSGAELSSWLQAAHSSWSQTALSSWNEAALSSWNQAATTSWSGGASETLSSFGQERSFFMHVNAEVIFYGGTDPRAKVTIDGKPITLNPDGSFRYHFIFPDGTYEIPIVATSPDGVETRSAVLRFDRGTQKTGKVDDTGQPALGIPMGAKS